jgi:phage terminase small subunit
MHATEVTYRNLLKKLTCREQKLVREFLIDGNASRSARAAGYSARSAPSTACETLKKPNVAATVQSGLALLAWRCEVTAERVVRELAAIAFASSYSFAASEEGVLGVAEGAAPEFGAALQIRHRRLQKGDGRFETETTYQQQDKLKALELLGKKLKLFVEKVEVENAQDAAYKLLLREIRARPGGE